MPIAVNGDSYGAGAYGVQLFNEIAIATGRPVVLVAAGGTTNEDQLATQQGRALIGPHHIGVDWDGSPNGFTTVGNARAVYQQKAALYPHGKFIFIPPGVLGTTRNTDMDAVRDNMITDFGASRVIDWLDVFTPLGDGSTLDNTCIANRCIPDSLRLPVGTDPARVHLTQAAMSGTAGGMGAAVAAKIVANGW